MKGKPLNRASLDKKISVRVDADRYLDLEQYAFDEGMSASFLVRHLVYRFVEDFKRQSSTRASSRIAGVDR